MGSIKKKAEAASTGPMQAVAGNLTRWTMMLVVGLGGLGGASAYMGLLGVASMLASIALVALTLYLFLKFWPEDSQPGSSSKAVPKTTPPPKRQAMVSAVRVDGPPKLRCILALREMVRRQESFQISQQGAERFAKTIRYLLRSKL